MLFVCFYQKKMWQSNGNFKNVCESGGDLNRWCEFENKQTQILRRIKLLGYKDRSITMSLEFASSKKQCHFVENMIKKNISVREIVGLDKIVHFEVDDPKKTYIVLQELVRVEASLRVVLKEICAILEISNTLGVNIEDCKRMPFEQVFEVLLEVQKNASYDLIYTYLKHLWQESLMATGCQNLQNIYKLACAVSCENIHYHEAQDMCVEILLRSNIKKQDVSSLEDEADTLDVLTLKFSHALCGSHQDLTDLLYHQLCGNAFGSPLTVQNIKGDAKTLIALAKIIREQSMSNQRTQ